MKTLRVMCALGVLLLSGCATRQVVDGGGTGMPPVAYRGWEQAFRLENDAATVVVVPATGRMMYLGLQDGANLLRNDAALAGHPPRDDATWTNFGGDWLWPVAQSRWSGLSQKDWPPPTVLRDKAWEGRAWYEPNGCQSCLLTRRYGAPINALVMRQFTLDADKAMVTVRQRMVATADTGIPLTLWSVTQLDRPRQVLFPVRAGSAFDRGYNVMMGDAPPGAMIDCGEILACDITSDKMSKLGMDAPVPWIAACKYDVVMRIEADNPFSGAYPDGGCSLQLFALGRNRYAELETLSPEFSLRAGASLGNTLTIELLRCHPGMSPCRLAERLRTEEK